MTVRFDATAFRAGERPRVLVAGTGAALREGQSAELARAGFEVTTLESLDAAARHLEAEAADLLVLHLDAPARQGLVFLRALRSAAIDCRVLCLAAQESCDDRVAALDAGADDVVTLPLAAAELRARLRALLRRGQGAARWRLVFRDLSVDLRRHVALRAGEDLGLSPRELHLLTLLLERQGAVVDRAFLLSEVWGADNGDRSNVLDVAVGRLRAKLEAGGRPQLVHTVRGQGYILR